VFVIRIGFSQIPNADVVAGGCPSLACARRGAPVVLSPGPREALPDPNPGCAACVDAPGLDAAFARSVVGSPAFRDAVRAAWGRALPLPLGGGRWGRRPAATPAAWCAAAG